MGEATTCGKQCDNCGSMFVFLTTRDVYAHQQTSGWPVVYYCGDCGASVGTHPDTVTPLGRMATGTTRYLRVKAHATFDTIWRCGFMTRDAAIRWAATELMIVEELHISTLSDENLEALIRISKQYLAGKQRYNLEQRQLKNGERLKKDARRISEHNARYAKRRRSKR